MKRNKIIRTTAPEGLGSCYERVRLYELLPRLMRKDVDSVLEFPATITKGWDNIAFLEKGLKVTIADDEVSKIEREWPYKLRPEFNPPENLQQKFDLVWNFAIVHQKPEIVEEMLKLSDKYILIFTPNGLNWGAPLHWGLHFLTGTKCNHPEKGHLKLMTLRGLESYLQNRGMQTVTAGYFDAPFWPDFAFSKEKIITELPFIKNLFSKKNSKPREKHANFEKTIEKAAKFEENLPEFAKPIIAHHQYVLRKFCTF